MTDQPVKRKPGRPRKVQPDVVAIGNDHEWGSVLVETIDKIGGFNGAPEAAFDHDGDGDPGGSKRKNAGVGKHELEALAREAFEAYDMQDDRVRFDSAGRKWVLRMDNSSGHWELSLHLSRGLHEASDSVSQIVLGSSAGYEAVEKAVKRLDGAVK